MKPVVIALLTAAAALSPRVAQADTRIHLDVGVGAPVHCAPPVLSYVPPPMVVHAPPARGYWEDVVVKSWVPERWITTRDRFGRIVQVFEPGYFVYRAERVWVATPGHHAPHGRAYGHRGHRHR